MGIGPNSRAKSETWPDRAILLLFVAGLVLYLPGIMWGVPYASAPDRIGAWGSDETAPLGSIAQVLHYVLHIDTRLDPRYPLLAYAVQFLFLAPYLAFLRLTGGLAGMVAEYPFGLTDPVSALSTMTVAARLPSLLMSAALPPIAYVTARTLWDRGTASLAGAFVLVLYPLFFYSRTSNVDSHALFWTALDLFVFAQYLRHGLTRRRAVLFGLFAALATASKDQSYAICGSAGIVLLVRSLGSDRQQGQGRPASHVLMGLATGAVVYSIASGLAFNPRAFLTHVDFITHGSGSPNFYFSNPATPLGYANVLLEFGDHIVSALGVPMAMAAAVGLLHAGFANRNALCLAIPVLGLLVGVILPVRFVLFRFIMPAAWLFALFAAHGANAVVRARPLRERAGPTLTRGAAIAIIGLIVGWALLRGLDLTAQMLQDSRFGAAAWLERNAQSGDTVGYYGSAAKLPALVAGIVTVRGPYEGSNTEIGLSSWPHFILTIPQQPFERDHEWTLPEHRYRELMAGVWGYDLMLATQTRSLFSDQPVTWVNPRVRIFVRRDIIPRLSDRAPIIEID